MDKKASKRFRAIFFIVTTLFGAVLLAESNPFASTATKFEDWVPPTGAISVSESDRQAVDALRAWCDRAFGGKEYVPPGGTLSLHVLRQDHSSLHRNRSCLNEPLQIGDKNYDRGLGTHATSEIFVTAPGAVCRFEAEIGVTHRNQGSVRFGVEAGGKEIFRSPVLQGGEAPVPIRVDLPEGTTRFILKVDNAADGDSCDQAAWAEARIVMADDTVRYLDEARTLSLGESLPFSFRYGGRDSKDLLPHWPLSTSSEQLGDRLRTNYSWTDPDTQLVVTAVVETFDSSGGVDWYLTFRNTGTKDTPLLEAVRSVDVIVQTGAAQNPLNIHTLKGDQCDAQSWLTQAFPLKRDEERNFQPVGGRSSNGTFPFWNITAGDDRHGHGVFLALGWSGQWTADFQRLPRSATRFSAGQQDLATILHPGETIRTPRILLMPWDGRRRDSHVRFRRLLMNHYAPKRPDGRPIKLPIAGQCFDRYYRKRAGWEMITGQKIYSETIARAGCDTLWFDAAWFPVGFPRGVGNWFKADPVTFPEGVKPLGDLAHKHGMQFILWFEPERVARGTELAEKYPQYVFEFEGRNSGLYKLNDPEARKFLIDLIAARIEEYGVDVYRCDFNIDPLPFWRANDEPNRRGITEIRYVEGHYEMWDTLRNKFPGLWIDNCASGGRRIDLETTMRAVPLWRSDTCCFPGNAQLDQNQTIGLSQYLPLFTGSAWESDPFTSRSSQSMGLITQYNYLDKDYDEKQAQSAIAEARLHQKFWYGDFYPITETTTDSGAWSAYQLHRTDLNAGIVYFFRRSESPYMAVQCQARNIDPEATYHVEIKTDYEDVAPKRMKGSELVDLEVRIPERKTTAVIRYWKP